MKKHTLKKLCVMATIPFIFTNCASILNGKYQKVTISTPSSNTEVFVNNESQGEGKQVVAKMQRDLTVKQIKIEREGYKPVYKVHYQDRKSPLYIMSWVPFGILFYPPFMDYGPKAYNFPKELKMSEAMLEIKTRQPDQKYVYLKSTAFDLKKEDIKYTSIKHKNVKKKKNKYKDLGKGEEDIKFDNTIFTDEVNGILKKYSYIDTTNTIYKSNTNTLYISAKVIKAEFDNVITSMGSSSILITKLDIEWEMFDLYNQSKFKKTLKSESGEFAKGFNGNDCLKNSITDAVTESFFKFMDTKEVKALIEQKDTKEQKLELLTLAKPGAVNSLEQAMEATVTIKVKEGHGSGCFVTNDGYIVTNFHVVAANDKITVVTKEGKEYPAKLIRKNEYSDLALIKIDYANQYAFTLPSVKNYKVGDDIFAIGTPKTVELGQSLSKGIISGFRTNEKMTMIQTDASVNGGNSGGALVGKNGEFIGVVNAKLFGVGVEGLGFSIPAESIFTDLSIKY